MANVEVVEECQRSHEALRVVVSKGVELQCH